MQTLIERVQAAVGGELSLTLGLVLLVGLVLLLILELGRGVRRYFFEGRQQRAALEKLRWQVQEAKHRWQEGEQAKLVWNGCRKFAVARKVLECEDVWAYYLRPHDGKALPGFKPGQYLTFQLDIPGREKPLVRCYSLSDSPDRAGHYRVTIKREKAPPNRPELPPGEASSYFSDQVKEGDILNVKAPTGHFFLDMGKMNPVVLIAGGVGVTPMLSMANAIASSGTKREAWFFFGVRSGKDHIHKAELEQLAAQHENIHLHVCYSRPDAGDVKGRDFQHEGRVSVELFKQLLPSNNFEYFLCGNGAFMVSITEGLEEWGVPEKDVHFEAFGPATVKKKTAIVPVVAAGAVMPQVTFSRSNKVVRWNPGSGNLLDFARAEGVKIDSGCCAGSCGSCLVAIKSGTVDYLKPPDVEPEHGACLTCVCQPQGDLILDA